MMSVNQKFEDGKCVLFRLRYILSILLTFILNLQMEP